MKLAIVGLGRMGMNMARRLLEGGHQVRGLVWPADRQPAKLAGLGIEVVEGDLASMADVRAALDGTLKDVETRIDPNFGIAVPTSCPDVPTEVLDPRNTWDDKEAYDEQARRLTGMFTEHFEPFADEVEPEVREAGPQTT